MSHKLRLQHTRCTALFPLCSTIWINNLNGKKSAPKPMLITTMLPEEPRYSLMTVCPSNHQCCPAIVHCYALLPSPQQHAVATVAAAWPRPHGHLGQQTSKLWHLLCCPRISTLLQKQLCHGSIGCLQHAVQPGSSLSFCSINAPGRQHMAAEAKSPLAIRTLSIVVESSDYM